MSIENLWGDLPVIDNIRTPLHILKEQAVQLGEMTSKVLEAEISKPQQLKTITGQELFSIDFDIIVPTMNFYRITILRVRYFIRDMYPVILQNLVSNNSEEIETKNEEDFKKTLESILTSTEVKRVISTLLTYAKEV